MMPTDPASVAPSASSAPAADALSPPRREKPATTTTKKRVMTTRAPSARNKDSKPKDEKEVMNFFDNLLKK
jgi:hypothetical protein